MNVKDDAAKKFIDFVRTGRATSGHDLNRLIKRPNVPTRRPALGRSGAKGR